MRAAGARPPLDHPVFGIGWAGPTGMPDGGCRARAQSAARDCGSLTRRIVAAELPASGKLPRDVIDDFGLPFEAGPENDGRKRRHFRQIAKRLDAGRVLVDAALQVAGEASRPAPQAPWCRCRRTCPPPAGDSLRAAPRRRARGLRSPQSEECRGYLAISRARANASWKS